MNETLFLTGAEMFEELNTGNINKYLEFIQPEELKTFIAKSYEIACKSLEDIEYENKVCEVLIDHLIRKGLLTQGAHQSFVDVLLTSVFLHNLYFDEKDLIGSITKPRIMLDELANDLNIPEQVREAIWDGVESQLGDATPIKKLKPSPNSPQDLLAECIFITRSLYRWFK